MGVYLARAVEYRIFKIGYSLTPESRVADISGGFPVEVTVDRIEEHASRHDERYLHECLERFRLRGEWFSDEGLFYARGLFDEMREARDTGGAEAAAFMIKEHVPDNLWDTVVFTLDAAGATNVAHALTNLVGQSVMDGEAA